MYARPKISASNRVVEILAFFALLGVFYPLLFLSRLGDGAILPIHYNILGKVDDWGEKGFLWLLPLIATVIYTGLSFLGRYSRKLKSPYGATTARTDMFRYMKLSVLLNFAYINNTSYFIATGKMENLNGIVMIILLCGLFLPVLFFAIKIKKQTKAA